jgi:6-phosphogluconolactonase
METTKQAKPRVTQVGDAEDLARTARDLFVRDAHEAVRRTGRFCVALSGGHTPQQFFGLLGEADIPWQSVQLFWVDERCVPPDAEASNYGLAAQTFLSRVEIPPANVHRISGESESLDEAVAAYEAQIREAFGLRAGQMPQFDLIVLGMCPDGHIGSLYPNTYALIDTEDIVSAVYLMDGDHNRITLTCPVLCAARHVVILVSGREKAQILQAVLASEPDEIRYPVHTLWPVLDKVTWIVDREAASLL